MSTKKNIITIEVDKLESLKKRIEVLQILGDSNVHFNVQNLNRC